MLRTASALRAAKISPQRISRTLKELRSALPEGSALNKISLTALGNRIAIREGQTLRESGSGAICAGAFKTSRRKAASIVITRGKTPRAIPPGRALRARARAFEDDNPQAARAAYELCLEADAEHLEARINLGRLLHLAGKLIEAERVYRLGAKSDPFIAFNLAVVLEDSVPTPSCSPGERHGSAVCRRPFQSRPPLRAGQRSQSLAAPPAGVPSYDGSRRVMYEPALYRFIKPNATSRKPPSPRAISGSPPRLVCDSSFKSMRHASCTTTYGWNGTASGATWPLRAGLR